MELISSLILAASFLVVLLIGVVFVSRLIDFVRGLIDSIRSDWEWWCMCRELRREWNREPTGVEVFAELARRLKHGKGNARRR